MEKYISSKKEYEIAKEHEVSEKLYNLVFGSVLLEGILINVLMVCLLPLFFKDIDIDAAWIVFLVVLACNVIVYIFSRNAIIYFIAYNFMSISFGLVMASWVSYIGNAMKIALAVTMVLTIIMMMLGCFISNIFSRMGKIVRIELFLSFIVIVVLSFFYDLFDIILSFIGVVIFSIFIAHDWAEANTCPKTIKNAVLNAVDIYMGIVNLFLDILHLIDIFSGD